MGSVFNHPVDRAELEPVLHRLLHGETTGHGALKQWRRRVSLYSSSSIITALHLRLEGQQSPLRWAFKDLNPAHLLPTARRVRPRFLYQPDREIAAYEQILDPLALGTPRYIGSHATHAPPGPWLFLEWVTGPLLWQLGRITHWQEAARWLARFHHRAVRLPGLGQRLKTLEPLQSAPSDYARWLNRAENALSQTLLKRDRRLAREFLRLARRYDEVVEHLCSLPCVLTHGEFFPANIVMPWNGSVHRVCPIDWELISWAPAVIDLAALCAGTWSSEQKDLILTAYLNETKALSRATPSLETLTRDVTHAQLHLCMRHLGWATRWRPQGQKDRAWLADALTLATKLGL